MLHEGNAFHSPNFTEFHSSCLGLIDPNLTTYSISGYPPSDLPAPSCSVLVSFFQFDIWSILSYLWTYLLSHILSSLLDIFRDVPKETLKSLIPICCSQKLPQTSWSLLVFTSFSIECCCFSLPLLKASVPLLLSCTASFPRMLSGNNLGCTQWSVGMMFEKPPDLCPWLGNFHLIPPLPTLLQFVCH